MAAKQLFAFSLAAVLWILMSACGGGSETNSTPAPTSMLVINNDELALMPLAATDLGGEFLGVPIDASSSGYRKSADVAEDTVDPSDSPADIESAGWLISYELRYSDPSLAALDAGSGILLGDSELDLFRDDNSARTFVDKQLADFDRLKGQRVAGGFKLTDSSRFEQPSIDESFGISFKLDFNGKTAHTWDAGFRRGRLIATVSVSRADDRDLTNSMNELAKTLSRRVDGVLQGTLQATAIPLPTPKPDAPGQASRPSDGPFPDSMALTAEDVGSGAFVKDAGYAPGDKSIAYKREFNHGPTGASGSPTLSLENDIDLYPSTDKASGFFAAIKGVFTGPSATDVITRALASSGLQVRNLTARETAISQGDESFALTVAYDTPLGRLENEFVYIRVDRVVGIVLFGELAGDLTPQTVESLASKLVAHIRAELGE